MNEIVDIENKNGLQLFAGLVSEIVLLQKLMINFNPWSIILQQRRM
jgi:hypothetical protein